MLTPEQEALSKSILEKTPTSGRACAGTGKTTTAVSALAKTSAKTLTVAFNKAAAGELAERLRSNSNVEAKTLNGLGHRLVMQFIGKRKLILDPQKIRTITDDMFPQLPFEDKLKVQHLTRAARIAGIVPREINNLKGLIPDTDENWESLSEENLEPHIINNAQAVLRRSISRATSEGFIDFDDQIYLSALNNNLISGYELLVVDEAQDLNPLQHKMLQKFYRTSVCIIGDPRQSIYGFRGAVSSSMEKLEEKFSLQLLPLTVNFRCAPEIISFAQQWCPEIRAGLTTKGIVDTLDNYQLEDLPSNAAILCRCNAPLLRLAFQLILAGRWPRFVGRDIGKSLNAVLNKITKKKNILQPQLSAAIDNYFRDQIAIAISRKQDHKVEGLQDRCDCLFAVLEQTNSKSADELSMNLKTFSEREGAGITLSSIHRAKGREWPIVFWLDQQLGEKYHARALAEGNFEAAQQETNLSYVCATRAKEQLLFINTYREL